MLLKEQIHNNPYHHFKKIFTSNANHSLIYTFKMFFLLLTMNDI